MPLIVGAAQDGTLIIENGGKVTGTTARLGSDNNVTGTVTVTGLNSEWTNTGTLSIGVGTGPGGGGIGVLNILNKGTVSNGTGEIASDALATGTVTVSGSGSKWTNTFLDVGYHGTAILNIENGGQVESGVSYIGDIIGSSGTVTVSGSGSKWTNTSYLLVGNALDPGGTGRTGGTGSLTIADGGIVSATMTWLAQYASAQGTVTLSGTDGARGMLTTGWILKGLGSARLNLDGGILQATANQANYLVGFAPGDVVIGNGGAFIDSNGYSIGVASVLSGTGGLTKMGAGILTLSGVNSYLGATTVSGGMLRVNGDLTSSSGITVNAGVLGGNGTASGVQVNASGTFAPGNGTPGSSMTVASLAMQSGAFYAVNLDPTTSSFANVTGTATLGGATVQAAFATVGGYVEKQYTILNAGSITGTFNSTVQKNNLPSGFKTSLSYDPTNTKVFLDLALNIVPPSPGLANNALPDNQSSVGNAITNFFNSTGHIPVAFGALTPQGLTQVSGEVGNGGQHTSNQATTQFVNVMSDVTSAGRGGAGGGAMGYAEDAMAYAGKKASSNPSDAFASFTKAPPQSFVQRWSTWAMGFGGSQTTDGNINAGTNTSSSSIYGAAVGADYRVSWDTVAGFALAGGGTNYSVVNGGTGRSDLFQLGAFVRHNIGATYLTASAAYGWQDVKTDRYVTVAGVDHLRAEFDTNSYSGRLELGHRFLSPWFGGLGVSPYAAAQVTAFELPSYSEQAVSGANTFALAYTAKTSTATRSELGIRTDKSFALESVVLTLRGRAAWAHDFNPNSAVSATFQTLPGASFVVNGASLAPDSALTTASAELSWINGWSVAGTFEGEFSNVTRSYAGKGVVRYNW